MHDGLHGRGKVARRIKYLADPKAPRGAIWPSLGFPDQRVVARGGRSPNPAPVALFFAAAGYEPVAAAAMIACQRPLACRFSRFAVRFSSKVLAGFFFVCFF
jgi:hypothetical protein